MATGSFSIENLVGEGSIGRVYRAAFDDGKVHNCLNAIIFSYFYKKVIHEGRLHTCTSLLCP